MPTMSMTADCLMLRSRMTAKKMIENTTGDMPLKNGVTLISNVVAAVLGMATMGPMHRITAHMRTFDATWPMRPVMLSAPPACRMANIATSARPISAIK